IKCNQRYILNYFLKHIKIYRKEDKKMKLGQLMTSASIMDGNSSDILGNIFWFSIGDMLMHEEDVKTKLQDAGISLDYMPNPIRVSDAFRRATTEVRRKR